MTRREQLYPEIKRMREVEGLKWREIGDRLGISLKTAFDYYDDPDNSKHIVRHRRWKAKDFAECKRCGGRMSGSARRAGATLCRDCHRAVEAAAQRARIEDAAEMYREGMSHREIARALGYGPNSNPPEITKARRLGLIGYRNRGYAVPSTAGDTISLETKKIGPGDASTSPGRGSKE